MQTWRSHFDIALFPGGGVNIVWRNPQLFEGDEENRLLLPRDFVELLDKIESSGATPFVDSLDFKENLNYARPNGSRRAIYLRDRGPGSDVLAIKGSEVLSSELEKVFVQDKSDGYLRERPWTRLENFVYREQKAPMALGVEEAVEEADKGRDFQNRIRASFARHEEAPMPLLVIQLPEQVTERYLDISHRYMSKRAFKIYASYVRHEGLAVSIYHYPYIPLRVRFEARHLVGQTPYERFEKLDNLVDIVCRMLLVDVLPFTRKDFGIGQCIAPQNVTINGGICDLGSLAMGFSEMCDVEVQGILRATGVLLSRTAMEMVFDETEDSFFEFNNPSTHMFRISAFVLQKMQDSLFRQAKERDLRIDPRVSQFLSNDNSAIIRSFWPDLEI